MPWDKELVKFSKQLSAVVEGIEAVKKSKKESQDSGSVSAIDEGGSVSAIDEERLAFRLPHIQSNPTISIPVRIFTSLERSTRFLGRGSYGDVYGYTDEQLQSSVAIKRINIPINGASKEVSEVRKEVGTNERLKHDNITQFVGSCEIENSLFIVMEYMEHGSLRGKLNSIREAGGLREGKSALEDDVIVRYIGDIVSGLVYLHLNKVIHRDLRAANVLLSGNDVAKIADFGISKELNSLSTQTGFSSVVGNTYWRSPELIENLMDKVGRKVDVWSLGITILEMIHVTPPFMSKYDPTAYMFALFRRNKDIIEIPEFVSDEIKDVLRKCLIVEVEDRPHSKDLLTWNQ